MDASATNLCDFIHYCLNFLLYIFGSVVEVLVALCVHFSTLYLCLMVLFIMCLFSDVPGSKYEIQHNTKLQMRQVRYITS